VQSHTLYEPNLEIARALPQHTLSVHPAKPWEIGVLPRGRHAQPIGVHSDQRPVDCPLPHRLLGICGMAQRYGKKADEWHEKNRRDDDPDQQPSPPTTTEAFGESSRLLNCSRRTVRIWIKRGFRHHRKLSPSSSPRRRSTGGHPVYHRPGDSGHPFAANRRLPQHSGARAVAGPFGTSSERTRADRRSPGPGGWLSCRVVRRGKRSPSLPGSIAPTSSPHLEWGRSGRPRRGGPVLERRSS
jgi:hypothetical protein